MSWVVSSSGSGMFNLPPADAPAWKSALEQLCGQPELLKQWGVEGRRALHERFSMTGCALSLASEYFISQNETRPSVDQSSILIVIQARDEEAIIGQLVQSIIAAGWKHIFVVDDHSSDDTGNIARRAGASVARPILRVGDWGGTQLGIRHAWAKGYRAVITLDADGQHEVPAIPRLLASVAKADVVIGAHPKRASRLRQLANRWFRTIANLELHDLTSGFRYYNRQAIEILASSEATLLDYQDVGVLLLLRKSGLQVMEVPVSMSTRQVKKSRNFYAWFSMARYMAITTLYCMARWSASTNSPASKNPPT
jgi:cellulose synthase/poly-beta-1,6-N-acetylglucosamine synthase-like glycosyltransferase